MDTRTQILEKNFESMKLNGFQGTRTDKVIAELGITKGAFYHYFPTKIDMGYAVVDEVISPRYTGLWKSIENYKGHPVDGIVKVLKTLMDMNCSQSVTLGCPLNNLMLEMSPLDEGFRLKLKSIVDCIHLYIANALKEGKKNRQVIGTVKPEQMAYFIFSSMEGSYSVAKSTQSKEIFDMSVKQLILFVHSLKA